MIGTLHYNDQLLYCLVMKWWAPFGSALKETAVYPASVWTIGKWLRARIGAGLPHSNPSFITSWETGTSNWKPSFCFFILRCASNSPMESLRRVNDLIFSNAWHTINLPWGLGTDFSACLINRVSPHCCDEATIQQSSVLYNLYDATGSYMWNLEKWCWWTRVQGRKRGTGVEGRLVDASGGRRGTNWDSSTDMYAYSTPCK